MEKNKHTTTIQVIYAKSLDELYYYQRSIMDLQVVGAGTTKEHLESTTQGKKSIVFTRGISDLCQIDKKERYIEIGSANSLTQIIDFGNKIIPQALFDALKSIANPFIRNLATIGGNICYAQRKLTLFSPLLALDARLEFKSTPIDTVYIPISQFKEVPKGYFLTKIRVPTEEWDISIFKRIGPQHSVNEFSAFFTFLAQIEKTLVVDVRIAFSGSITFRHKEIENKLLGVRLPLNPRLKNELIAEAKELYEKDYSKNVTAKNTQDISLSDTEALLKQQYVNLLSFALDYLS